MSILAGAGWRHGRPAVSRAWKREVGEWKKVESESGRFFWWVIIIFFSYIKCKSKGDRRNIHSKGQVKLKGECKIPKNFMSLYCNIFVMEGSNNSLY